MSKETFPAPTAWTDLMNEPQPNRKWLAAPIIPAGGNVLIAGYPKTLKTFFALDLAIALASGTPFLGRYRVPENGRVGIVIMEGGRWQLSNRLRRLAMAHDVEPADLNGPVHVWYRPPFQLHDQDAIRALTWYVKTLDLDVLIVDAWAYVATGNENAAHEVTPQLVKLSDVGRDVPGFTQILVHHARLEGEGRQDSRITDMVRGSGAFGAWYDCGIALSRKDERSPVGVRIELREHESPDQFWFSAEDEQSASPLNDHQAQGALSLRATDERPINRAQEDRKQSILHNVVAYVEQNSGCSKTDIETKVTGAGTAVRSVRDEAAKNGLIEDDGKEGQFGRSAYSVTEAGLAFLGSSSSAVPPTGGGTAGRPTSTESDAKSDETEGGGVEELSEEDRQYADAERAGMQMDSDLDAEPASPVLEGL